MIGILVSPVLIGIILLAIRVLKNHISVMWQYRMRYLYIAVLIMPFIPARLLNFGFLKNIFFWNTGISVNSAASLLRPGVGGSIALSADWLQDFAISVNRSAPQYLGVLIACIWLAGVLAYAVFTFICYEKIRRIKKSSVPIENSVYAGIFEKCKAELGITKKLAFCKSHMIQSPTVTGIFRTYIILPAKYMEEISESEIKYIILHELNHYKNKDLLVNYIMCVLRVLYWFHPLVHLIFEVMRADREIACDASVLKTLDKSNFANYGLAIINFAERLSRPVSSFLAADMAGTKKEIIKRIEKIAAYTEDSRRLKIKSVGIFVLAVLAVLSQIPVISAASEGGEYVFEESESTVYEDLSTYFEGFNGSFVLYDLQQDSYSIYNKSKSVTRVSPHSTCKIYSALIGLELNVIQEDNSALKWDGIDYPYEAWNKDHDLYSAMQSSVSWYFQAVDKLSGLKNLQYYFEDMAYGNYNLSSGVSNYWMDSTLLISPVEQVRLLKDFYLEELSFKPENIRTVKNTLKLSENNGAVLSGKTGTGSVNGKSESGWFIGYVEKNDNTYIFAVNIQGKEGAGGSAAAQIALSILSEKNIYKE